MVPYLREGQRKEDAHRTVKHKGDKAIASLDYKNFCEKEDADDKITTIVLKDEVYGSTAAHVCKQK